MERIDKIVSNYSSYTRSEVKKLIKSNLIKVNDVVVNKPETKVDEFSDVIKIEDKVLIIKDKVYLVLNKPKGVISATEDMYDETVLDLIDEEYLVRNIFPVGRLDKDTTGLLILTNDGDFSHSILSPKKNHKKIYKVKIDIPITDKMVEGFKKGVKLKDEKCKEAILEKISTYEAYVTITEGKYHQIKRMFGCYEAKVVELERIQIGEFKLPKELHRGDYRELTEEELELIKKWNIIWYIFVL